MSSADFISKTELQNIVNEKISVLGYTLEDYPLDPFKIAKKLEIEVEEVDYKTPKIGGQIYLGKTIKRITLNKCRTERGKRFD
jgi:type VI protein secretion system component Hcp